MDRESLFTSLTTFCQTYEESEDGIPNTLDAVKIYETLIQIAKTSPHTIQYYLPILMQYITAIPTCKEEGMEPVKKEIEIMKEANLDERIKIMSPFVQLLPYFADQQIYSLYDLIVKTISEYYSANSKLPLQFCKAVARINGDANAAELLFAHFRETADVFGSIVTFTPIAPASIEAAEDSVEFIVSSIEKAINSEKPNKLSALFFIQNTHEADFIPPNFFNSIASFLVDEDIDISYAAHKCLYSLIENQIYTTPKYVAGLLALYSKYKEPLPFFKIIFKILDNEETSLEILQRIFDFLNRTLIRETSPTVRGLILESFSMIASISATFVSTFYKDGIKTAQEILSNKQYEAFTNVANFYVEIHNAKKQEIESETITALSSTLLDEATGTIKSRLERAEAIAMFSDEKVPAIEELILKSIDDQSALFYTLSVILADRKFLSENAVSTVYSKLWQFASSETDLSRLNAILHTLKKLLKLSTSLDCSEAALSICDGRLKILDGLKPFVIQDPDTMIFSFLAACISRGCKEVMPKILEWLPSISVPLYSTALEPVMIGLENGLIDDQAAKSIMQLLIGVFVGVDLSDEKTVIATCEVLAKIAEKCQIDGQTLLTALHNAIAVTFNEEEQAYESESAIGVPAIVKLILKLYQLGLVEDEKIETEVLNMLPFPPQMVDMAAICESLLVILEKAKNDQAVIIGRIFATLLLMRPSEIKEYGLEKEITDKMKAALKTLKAKGLDKQIGKPFTTDRRKTTQFNALFK